MFCNAFVHTPVQSWLPDVCWIALIVITCSEFFSQCVSGALVYHHHHVQNLISRCCPISVEHTSRYINLVIGLTITRSGCSFAHQSLLITNRALITCDIPLQLQDDAERLLKNCKRFDLLNSFYQSSGQWSKAIETAEMYDRIHLRQTYYNYAKHLEGKGDINAAIPQWVFFFNSSKEVLSLPTFVSDSVCVFVCLLPTLLNKLWMYFDEIFSIVQQWYKEQLIRVWEVIKRHLRSVNEPNI